jgi:hypothetical protein
VAFIQQQVVSPLPLIEGTKEEGEKTIEHNPDQTQLTTWYTERAVQFIADNRERPFFLYVPHNMPHVPLFVSDKFKGKTERGLFGDVIAEIDWSVGEILKHETHVTSRWFSSAATTGVSWRSCRLVSRAEGTTWLVASRPQRQRWPVRGSKLTNCAAPSTRNARKLAGTEAGPIDHRRARDRPPLAGEPESVTCEAFRYYSLAGSDPRRQLGCISARLSHGDGPRKDGLPGDYKQATTDLALYDLAADIGESKNVAADHADVVARLQALAEAAREDLGDSLTKRTGKNRRPAGKLQE